MARPSWTLDDDLKTVTIAFPSIPPVALKLDASGVDDVLKRLGEFRAMMTPGVPAEPDLQGKHGAIPDPAWLSSTEPLQGLSAHLRDPRFGWLHFLFPPHEAKHIGELLLKQVEAQPPLPSRDKAN